MPLAACVFITWSVIVVLALIPKRLTEPEMVFLFLVNTIFELSLFTVFSLNLHWLVVSSSVESSIANLVIRLLCIPLALVIVSNTMLHRSKTPKYGASILSIAWAVLLYKLMLWLGILRQPHWNTLYTALMFVAGLMFTRLMVWFIVRIPKREESIHDHV